MWCSISHQSPPEPSKPILFTCSLVERWVLSIVQIGNHGNNVNKSKVVKMAGEEIKSKNNFLMSINGQIHSAFFPYFDDVYCKYSFVCGPDWVIISGVEEGISQISKKGQDDEQLFIWNLPLNIVLKSTNPFGWPQLVISAYGLDVFGNEVVRGYGVCHVPIAPGHNEKKIPMFVPESSSIIQKFTSWLTGRRPEFIDPRILTQGDAREVAKVRSQGYVKVVFDTTMKGLQALGYKYS